MAITNKEYVNNKIVADIEKFLCDILISGDESEISFYAITSYYYQDQPLYEGSHYLVNIRKLCSRVVVGYNRKLFDRALKRLLVDDIFKLKKVVVIDPSYYKTDKKTMIPTLQVTTKKRHRIIIYTELLNL